METKPSTLKHPLNIEHCHVEQPKSNSCREALFSLPLTWFPQKIESTLKQKQTPLPIHSVKHLVQSIQESKWQFQRLFPTSHLFICTDACTVRKDIGLYYVICHGIEPAMLAGIIVGQMVNSLFLRSLNPSEPRKKPLFPLY